MRLIVPVVCAALLACKTAPEMPTGPKPGTPPAIVAKYAKVKLTTDLSVLSDAEKAMIPLLIEASAQMETIFWQQAYGDRDALMAKITDPVAKRAVEINFGPWDRLDGNAPFIDGVGAKPAGAGFYPATMTKEAFEAYVKANPDQAEALTSLYTIVTADGDRLVAVPYSEAFKAPTMIAAAKLREAAALADEAGLKLYLELRAHALETDDYLASDLAWMDMKLNGIDVVIGPIENYEDQLFGHKAAHEGYVLVKDRAWSDRLSHYAALLPGLQRGLPVPDAYKTETPGTDSDLNAYDVVFYAGDCNAGSKTIAINLPNDERVQLQKGTRRLQLKNAMRAKFDEILMPIAGVLIAEDQRAQITFDAFFNNVMFHEVAHGLGIKETINGKGNVRVALQEQGSAVEEGKADILGLYMIAKLFEQGELTQGTLEQHYVTFLGGIFRSVRFGASSAHGRANMLRFNFFKKAGAFSRDEATGTYRVDFTKMGEATEALAKKLLMLQGDGDYEGVKAVMAEMGAVGPELKADLDRLSKAGVPVDVVFEQGVELLGL